MNHALGIALAAALVLAAGCSQGPANQPPAKFTPTATATPTAPTASTATRAATPPVGAPAPSATGGSKPAAQEALLLLDDLPAEPSKDQKPLPVIRHPMADNGRCEVCHMNFATERLAVAHARVQVGCTLCHGDCVAHSNDEGNITVPDIIYAKGDIAAACKKCHPDDRAAPDGTCPEVVLDTDAKRYCTDCHGDHHMATRTVHWDKATRKLIPRATSTGDAAM